VSPFLTANLSFWFLETISLSVFLGFLLGTPGTCVCVGLHAKKNFVYVRKLRILDREIILDSPSGTNAILSVKEIGKGV
jgi:hypothetical protein